MDKEKRDECGIKGHEFVMSEEVMMSAKMMGKNFIDHMETAFEKWTPRKKFNIYKA
jgi:hypothetical protein